MAHLSNLDMDSIFSYQNSRKLFQAITESYREPKYQSNSENKVEFTHLNLKTS